MNNQRLYRWSLITYASFDDFKPLLEKSLHYAYIYHDKDNNEPHYHILVTFSQHISLSAIKKLIDSNQNTLGQPLKDNLAMFEYLTHENLSETEKEIYSTESRICDNLAFWTSATVDKDQENEQFIDDLLNLSAYEMAKKYGRDYIRNYERYKLFRAVLIDESLGPSETFIPGKTYTPVEIDTNGETDII